MLVVISPAKTLDYETPAPISKATEPKFLDHSQELVDVLKGYSPDQIGKLMKLSDKLAVLNSNRYQDWQLPFPVGESKQALLAFKGDVYTGLEAEEFEKKDFDFAQKNLRILSGLYGLLKPLDKMLPYRLEMGTKLENPRGKNLYDFWGTLITDELSKELKGRPLVNLASNEYFKSVKPKNLGSNVITPVFKDEKNGQYKVISFFAKKARGMMASYIIKNQLNDPEQLKSFDVAGYRFDPKSSNDEEYVFLREEQAS